ncbi:fatty acid elongation protein, GNS1/SUR4 family, putative [Plasmodium vivax]|uniref:Elongation of fatty acids protein n=6 Tax=Plasmodium vivax TaxID=5855 RepID=A5K9S4_PLAVS|nr:elongation of very long chain fatty acids protein 3, putative [Plasmodium vivax]KMZ82912.1 elongation- long chain fatty acids protein 3 [Plasmodium vivax India VII]KMZ89210.1 elongation- long chain fatty acids protein 3 [Plasmodium vivax Brazil I]KMZ95533.1 elongation- long chain fatty acids protein 3 [Plasmodium vivax Mauritania I]KNA02117.1 elongation- long chain fatty acids protein 3 [Plasmodium vivax North Korean]EDL43812.1 elongation of very long chain fatty acids protein 3, putative [|eukprot:XP_001613539.1 elongation of very long chain fatty acids protein 3 [Plasmodium vivax Sal-1]
MITKTNDSGYFRILGDVRNYPTQPAFRIEDVFPFCAWISFQWERNFKPFGFIELVHGKYLACPLIVVLYLLMCKYGPASMKNRKEFDLRRVVIVWNVLLSLFNLIVVVKLTPVLLYIICNYTFTGLLIIPPIYTYAFGIPGLWVSLFVLSKFVELADTLLLILRKKKVTLLHWFHHSTVLLYTWDTYYAEVPAGFTFVFINAIVHTIMYCYYAMASVYKKPLSWNICVTLLQILQMLLGILLTVYCLSITYTYRFSSYWDLRSVRKLQHKFSFDYGHYVSRTNVFYAVLMYLSYLFLFAKYFYGRYLCAPPGKQKPA